MGNLGSGLRDRRPHESGVLEEQLQDMRRVTEMMLSDCNGNASATHFLHMHRGPEATGQGCAQPPESGSPLLGSVRTVALWAAVGLSAALQHAPVYAQRPCQRRPTAHGAVAQPPRPQRRPVEAAAQIPPAPKPPEAPGSEAPEQHHGEVPATVQTLRSRADQMLREFLDREEWREAKGVSDFDTFLKEGLLEFPQERYAYIALRSRLALLLKTKLQRGEPVFQRAPEPGEDPQFPSMQDLFTLVVTTRTHELGDPKVIDFHVDHRGVSVRWDCSGFAMRQAQMLPYPISPSVVSALLPSSEDRDLLALLALRVQCACLDYECGRTRADIQELEWRMGQSDVPWNYHRTPEELPGLHHRRREKSAELSKLRSLLTYWECRVGVPRDRVAAHLLQELRAGRNVLQLDLPLDRTEALLLRGARAIEVLSGWRGGGETVDLLITESEGDAYGVDPSVASRVLQAALREAASDSPAPLRSPLPPEARRGDQP